MVSSKSVYLAGPITGLSYGDARYGWREKFTELLKAQSPHIECFSPMRSKEFLSDHQSLECRGEDLQRIEFALSRPLGILTRDFNDVTQRDAMVACFLGAQRVSIGTVWEIGVAYSHRKPVVVVMEDAKKVVTDTKLVTETISTSDLIQSGNDLHEAVERRVAEKKYGAAEIVGKYEDVSSGCWIVNLKVPGKTEIITNVHDHVFVTHTSGYVVPTLEEAALILGSILTPGV